MAEYQNAIHDAAQTSGSNSTYHTLSGQANRILLCSTSTGNAFFFTFNSTYATGNTTSCQYVPGDYPILISCDHPTYITILGGSSGYVYMTEFI